jgi:uncharacterized protein YndB with AHSA1/START domain
MGRLHIQAEAITRADPETVWSLVADANTYPTWGPWRDGGYQPPASGPSEEGSVQWFEFSRFTTTKEKVLEVEAPRRLVYTVLQGVPVKNYRAEVTVTPEPERGTSVHWAASWEGTLAGRLVRRRLQKVYRQVVEALVAAADNRTSPEST